MSKNKRMKKPTTTKNNLSENNNMKTESQQPKFNAGDRVVMMNRKDGFPSGTVIEVCQMNCFYLYKIELDEEHQTLDNLKSSKSVLEENLEKKEKFDEFLKSNHDGKHLENGSQETSSPSHMSLKNNLCPAKKGKTDELNKFCNDHGPNPPTIQQVHEHHESTYSGRDSTSMQLTFKDSAVVSCSGRITRPEGQHLNSELLNPNQVYLSASKYCIPPKKKMPVYNPSPINGYVPPIGTEKITNLIGEFRGIQGQHNSCYMDATLFAMFAFNNTFDSILVRPRRPKDPEVFNDIQKLLKECVVNNLRKRHFVHWKSVMQIRQLLVGLSRDSGMTTDERDPEEFLELLLGKCFDVAPFLKFNNGNELYVYQMFLENTNVFSVPTFEQLLHHSFKMFDLRLSKVPSVLVVQLPRSGNKFKSFRRVKPSLKLDITDLLENRPHRCSVCSKLARFECSDCFNTRQNLTSDCFYCVDCFQERHKRFHHTFKGLQVDKFESLFMNQLGDETRTCLELFAVLCIETSHYVCFTRTGYEPDAKWLFFNSMADREGGQDGFNIPKGEEYHNYKFAKITDYGCNIRYDKEDIEFKSLDELSRRMLSDSYICFYRNTKPLFSS